MWGDIDFMFVRYAAGHAACSANCIQSITVDGIIVVTSPQELVSMIVSKAVRMAEIMDVSIIGLVENMSYFRCPDNGKDYKVFGESHIDEVAEKHNLRVLAKLPIDPKISEACDKGEIELYDGNWVDLLQKNIREMGKYVSRGGYMYPPHLFCSSGADPCIRLIYILFSSRGGPVYLPHLYFDR